MTPVGIIASLWRYPVKSLLGEQCDELTIDDRGVAGDRWFAITTPEGKFGSGKNTRRFRAIQGLFEFQSYYAAGQVMVRFPDGRVIAGDDPGIDQALAAALGQPVTLQVEAAVPHFDAGALHIVTTGSLEWLRAQLPHSTIDERRFRPNIVIQTEGSSPVELEWLGRTIAIGEVTLEITRPTERCVMTTLAQSDLPANPEILQYLADALELNFGVYARVVREGNLRTGDPVIIA